MTRVGFEPTISAGERPKTYALDHAATGTGLTHILVTLNNLLIICVSNRLTNEYFVILEFPVVSMLAILWQVL